jgi:DNA polymerase III subunit epsilon
MTELQSLIQIIRSGDFLVLDTETTGLGSDAEICQIAIIDAQGNVLLDTLVKPVQPIPQTATAIHGITNEMVASAGIFPADLVCSLIADKHVIIYNAGYDVPLMYQSVEALGISGDAIIDWDVMANFHCAMKAFAPIAGDWNSYRKSYRWKSLAAACSFYGIPVPEDAHSALADCLSTLAVCKAMAAEAVK